MEAEKVSLIPNGEFLREMRAAISDEFKKMQQEARQQQGEQLFYVAQVAKRLRKSHKTIKNLVLSGVIRSTKNGMIPESALEEFLKGN